MQSNGQNDTINIAAGTYSAGGTPFTYNGASGENRSLTMSGAGMEATILDGGNIDQVFRIETSTSFLITNSNLAITLKNLSVQNGKVTSGDGGGLYLSIRSENAVIENCRFNDNSAQSSSGGFLGGGAFVQTYRGNIILTNNMFINNFISTTAESVAFGGGFDALTAFGDITLTNNYIKFH